MAVEPRPCAILVIGGTLRVGRPTPRFRTIQVCPKDLASAVNDPPLVLMKHAVDSARYTDRSRQRHPSNGRATPCTRSPGARLDAASLERLLQRLVLRPTRAS